MKHANGTYKAYAWHEVVMLGATMQTKSATFALKEITGLSTITEKKLMRIEKYAKQ